MAKTMGVAAVLTVMVGRPRMAHWKIAHPLTVAAITQTSIAIDRFLPTGCIYIFPQTEQWAQTEQWTYPYKD